MRGWKGHRAGVCPALCGDERDGQGDNQFWAQCAPAYGGDERAETASPIQATMSAPRYAGMKDILDQG